MIPYEELLMEPNRTPAERLGAIVGRRFVFSREQWPAWQRLVARYTWPVVIKAADACDPTRRFSNHVEAMCQQLASVAQSDAHSRSRREERVVRGDGPGRAREFAEILKTKGLRP